ncbi:MAG: hypothetical protein K6G12_07985 [Lachnospiraceae bacterium]|nr:hypothetical protein [Lachnospiraceae bacterium]
MDAETIVREVERVHADNGKNSSSRSVKKNKANRSSSVDKKAQRRKAARKKEVTLYLIEAAVALIAMASIIGFIVWKNSFTKIKISDYVEVSLSGYDHYGTAVLSVYGEPEYSEFWSTVTVSVNRESGLSNGDELIIKYKYDEEAAKSCKLKVDSTDVSLTVDGLMQSTVVDNDFLFSGLSVTQNGLSPKISVTLENTSEDPFLSQVSYYIDEEKSFFANGDTVKIRAEIPEELFESHEYVPAGSTDDLVYEYTPSSEDRYVMSADAITDDVLSKLEQIGADLIYASDANEYGLRIFQQEAHIQPVFKGNKTTFKWVNPYMISAYFHSVTDTGINMVENHANDVQIVYGVTITQADGKNCLAEVVVQFTNIVEHADHTLELSADNGRVVSATYRDRNVKALVSVDSSLDYDTVKLTE